MNHPCMLVRGMPFSDVLECTGWVEGLQLRLNRELAMAYDEELVWLTNPLPPFGYWHTVMVPVMEGTDWENDHPLLADHVAVVVPPPTFVLKEWVEGILSIDQMEGDGGQTEKWPFYWLGGYSPYRSVCVKWLNAINPLPFYCYCAGDSWADGNARYQVKTCGPRRFSSVHVAMWASTIKRWEELLRLRAEFLYPDDLVMQHHVYQVIVREESSNARVR